MMAGLKDVAVAAGVSIRTVARALQGTGYVDSATRKRVVSKARELDYRPNLAARTLRTARSFEISVLAWSMEELHVNKIIGLEQTFRAAHYSVNVLFGVPDPGGSKELLDAIRQRRPAGVVILHAPENVMSALARGLNEEQIPAIGIDTQTPGLDSIRIDRQQGVYEAVLYLAGKGRQHIAYLGYQHDRSRLDGYHRALTQLGREPIMIAVDEAEQFRGGRSAGRRFATMKPHPDAVQAYTDDMALGFLAGLHEQNIAVPGEVALIGFNDNRAAALAAPPLTTVAQPSHEIGVAAAEGLLGKLSGARPPAHNWTRTLSTRLIVRESA
jgi:DNA-binding LacI/PurR family transcriptional regulator